jgi:hypothetical protein
MMTLCVLCAGHRESRGPIGGEVSAALETLFSLCEKVGATLKDSALLEESVPVRLLAGGADGFDDIAAKSAYARQWPVHAVLTSLSQVDKHAHDAERIVLLEAPSDATSAEQEFLIAARDEFALAYSDLLIAYWDGGAPQGVAGGTVRLIRSALLCGRSLVVIGPDGVLRFASLSRRHPAQLRALEVGDASPLLIEQFLSPFDADIFAADLSALLDPHSPASGGAHARDWAALRGALKDKTQTKPSVWRKRAGRVDKLMLNMLAPKDGKRWSALRRALSHTTNEPYYLVDWASTIPEESAPRPHEEPSCLQRAFDAFDARANQCAGINRDLNWALHLLSAFAVLAAVAGTLHLGVEHHSLFWPLAEVAAVGSILFLFGITVRNKWHEQWLSSRYQAELIRYARMSMTLLAVPHTLKIPLFSLGAYGGLRLLSPEEWRLRRLLLEEGMPRSIDKLPYRPATHAADLSRYLLAVLEGQISYHDKNAKQYHHAEHNLHKLVTGCFMVTAIAVVAHTVVHLSWLLLFTAALPALAGALHAIGVNTEFKRLAAMSLQTKKQLITMREAIQHACSNVPEPARAWNTLRSLAIASANEMSGSARQWQELVEHRGLGLPA